MSHHVRHRRRRRLATGLFLFLDLRALRTQRELMSFDRPGSTIPPLYTLLRLPPVYGIRSTRLE